MAQSPGLIIAAPASGSGKTVVTLGLLRHLASSGYSVASAKAGPDYIDPAFHVVANSDQQCLNLDCWGMREQTLRALALGLSSSSDITICEGVMGLFDGAFVKLGQNSGSTADLSAVTGWPVVLVIDARAHAESAAAVLKGFADYRPDVDVVGVIFNRVGGARHSEMLNRACEQALPDIPVLGCLPRGEGLALPERHLGLVQAVEHPDLEGFIESARSLVAEHLDVEQLLKLPRPLKLTADGTAAPFPPIGQRIAVAKDEAFAFSYASVIEGWRRSGAAVTFFSPLENEAPGADADAVYLPGGYPELQAGRLAAASHFMDGLRLSAKSGAMVFGECGGYMVLGRGLIVADGKRHAMAGLLAVETSFAAPTLHLGYRRLETLADGPLGDAGTAFRGHEFHYAKVVAEQGQEDAGLFEAQDASGNDLGSVGMVDGNVAGSFIHLIDRE